jgi:hypothetical protein
MTSETSKAVDVVSSDLMAYRGPEESASAAGYYIFKCYDADGNLKWEDVAHNKVMNAGVQDMNTKYFTGSAYTAAWYLGLITANVSNAYNFTDTMSSHPNWTENTTYSQANRVTCTFGTASTATASAISNSSSTATFSMTGTTTIGGAFLSSSNVKSPGTAGLLFSAANFQSPGDRSVINGDTLVVTYTFTLTAT